MITWMRFETPLGAMLAIAEDDAIASLDFTDARYARRVGPEWRESPRSPLLLECARQVREYFAGRRRAFDLALAPRGTDFQRRVWKEIARIPYAATITYAELARRSGAAGSARAAGSATGRNPLAIVVPCHRVLGADGALTGYAGGLERKAKLLAREGAIEEAAA